MDSALNDGSLVFAFSIAVVAVSLATWNRRSRR